MKCRFYYMKYDSKSGFSVLVAVIFGKTKKVRKITKNKLKQFKKHKWDSYKVKILTDFNFYRTFFTAVFKARRTYVRLTP